MDSILGLDDCADPAHAFAIAGAHGRGGSAGGREDAESLVDVRLRSANELGGYHVMARDGEVGHVEDLLLDDDLSRVLFVVVEVKGWLLRKKVLVGPSLISQVDWATSTVHVNANCQALKNGQAYNPAT